MSRNFRIGHERRAPRPLDLAALEALALAYVGRYATTRTRIANYLRRKLKERGWEGAGEPPIAAVVARLAELKYVDDAAFAEARGTALARRGYGARRVAQALAAAGVDEADSADVRTTVETQAMEAALVFARRRRIGPFAARELDREQRRKAFAAMLRAGHAPAIARRVIDAAPGADIERD